MKSFARLGLGIGIGLLALVQDSLAENPAKLPLSGRVYSDVFVPASDPLHRSLQQVSSSLWVQGDPQFNEATQARFIFTGELFDKSLNSDASNSFRAGLREGWVSYLKDGWEVKLGKQIHPWGKSDAINPTDYLTAKDYTLRNPDEEVKRLGANQLWISWSPSQGMSPYNFTAVWTPVFAQSRFLIPSASVPQGTGLNILTTPVSPSLSLKDSELALKASYLGLGWDLSLSSFRGFSHLPQFESLGTQVYPTFHSVRALGTDASYSSEKWIYRVESAYFWTSNDSGQDALVQPSHLDTVFGLERPLDEDFRFQLQVFWRYHPHYLPPQDQSGSSATSIAVNQQVARTNALLVGYQERSRVMPTFRLSYSKEATGWEAEVFVLANLTAGDYLFRPKITYAWSDALKTTLGTEYYGGPTDKTLGALHEFNAVFAEAKYSF